MFFSNWKVIRKFITLPKRLTIKNWNIFYSWQSDLSSETNRCAIRVALKEVCVNIEKDLVEVQVKVDEATRDTPGSPNIPETIFRKIANSDIFIADITTINSESAKRKVPNPNILIELGYAVAYLGWSRIILVFNKFDRNFPDDVPFDIDKQRIIAYEIMNKEDTKGKGDLKSKLKKAMKEIIELNPIKAFREAFMSPEEIKRKRDIHNLALVFSNIHMPTMENFIEKIPDVIIDRILYFWHGVNRITSSSTFHLYDKKAKSLVGDIVKHWREILSHENHYQVDREKLCFFTQKGFLTGEQKKIYDNLQEEKQKLSQTYFKLVKYIREKYIEVDLEETSKTANIEYLLWHNKDS